MSFVFTFHPSNSHFLSLSLRSSSFRFPPFFVPPFLLSASLSLFYFLTLLLPFSPSVAIEKESCFPESLESWGREAARAGLAGSSQNFLGICRPGYFSLSLHETFLFFRWKPFSDTFFLSLPFAFCFFLAAQFSSAQVPSWNLWRERVSCASRVSCLHLWHDGSSPCFPTHGVYHHACCIFLRTSSFSLSLPSPHLPTLPISYFLICKTACQQCTFSWLYSASLSQAARDSSAFYLLQ